MPNRPLKKGMKMSGKKKPPIVPLDVADTDETQEPTGENLRFNEEADSFELDAETDDTEYRHRDPYETAAVHGEDAQSSYDEANPYATDEYRDVEGQMAELDDEITDDQLAQLDEADERLADRPEKEREGLDAEGYPLRDDAGGPENPIQPDPGAG